MIQRKFFHEMKPFHNHIGTVLDGDRLVRLIGVAESDIDVYYHVRYAGGEEAYMTAVGAFESLKGKLTRYDILEDNFTINKCPPTRHFTYRIADTVDFSWGSED
jgi:hypothetical protein